MENLKQRILDNIKSDAINFVRKGIPMPIRDPMWDTDVQAAISDAQGAYTPESKKRKGRKPLTYAQRLERFKKKIQAKQGISYDEWRKIAASLYSIDPTTFTVTSIARGPDHKRTWNASDDLAAQEIVYRLMNYKHYDHFEREDRLADFAYVPEEKKDA